MSFVIPPHAGSYNGRSYVNQRESQSIEPEDELTAGDELVNTKLINPSLAACRTKLALIPK